MNKNNDNYNTNDVNRNIASAKNDIKLAVNRSLYQKGVITEEMYIKAKEMLISAPSPGISKKKRANSMER